MLLIATGLGSLAYRSVVQLINVSTDELVTRISGSSNSYLQALFNPAESVADILADSGVLAGDTVDKRWPAIRQMITGLEQSVDITSVYMGNAEGDFLLLRRLPEDPAALERFNPPEGTRYVVQSLERDAAGTAAGRYIYLAADQTILKDEPRADYVSYDPRKRPWYGAANSATGLIVTAPYVFFTTREVGTTVAKANSAAGFVVGVDLMEWSAPPQTRPRDGPKWC